MIFLSILDPSIYFLLSLLRHCSWSNYFIFNSRVSKIWRRSSRSGPWRTTFCRNISRSRSTRNRKISSQSSSRDRTKGHQILADSNHVKFILNISPWNQLHFILDIVKNHSQGYLIEFTKHVRFCRVTHFRCSVPQPISSPSRRFEASPWRKSGILASARKADLVQNET